LLNFDDVYRENRSYVLRRCMLMTRSREDAEDLTQEVFICVLRNLHRFDGRSKVSTWLYRIVVNTVLMSRRRKQLPIAPLGDMDPPARHSAVRDLAVREALESIPVKDRQVLFRTYVNGETYDEISADGEPATTLKSRCLRARRKFKDALA
jgi:RNA polymerase sigma factor (sigma-70 family)